MTIYKRDSNNEFRELFKNLPAINWCKFIDGTSKYSANFMAKIPIILVKSKLPEMAQRCPQGPMIVHRANFTVESKLISMFPNGFYRITVTMKYRKGELMFDFSMLMELV